MREDLEVSNSIDINADSTKVWKALTDPEIIKDYLFGTETVTDWKPGSEVVFQGEYEGKKYRDHGIVKENVENKLLSYTYWSGMSGLEDKPENYSLITYTLKPIEDNITTFTWTQKGYADEDSYNHTMNGMDDFLKKIKEVVEKT
ncbi:MAG: SRPBCC family protein [bacterium]